MYVVSGNRCCPNGDCMKQIPVTIPELVLIAGTRAALGAGLALVLSDRLNGNQRRAVGWTLLAVGVVSTLPLARGIIGKLQSASKGDVAQPEGVVEGDIA